jgi:hypothetical protein
MDEMVGAIIASVIWLIISFGAYSSGKEYVREQAVIAGVGCYAAQSTEQAGRTEFRFNCKKGE